MSVLHKWQNDCKSTLDKTDFEQCSEALHKFSGLALWGIMYYIANEPAGFIIGEALNKDVFCLHFAKAFKKYHGIYEFMFNDTAKDCSPSINTLIWKRIWVIKIYGEQKVPTERNFS